MFGLLAGAGEIGRGEMDRERLDKKKASAAAADKGAPPKRKKRTHEEKTLPLKPVQQPKVRINRFRHRMEVLLCMPFLGEALKAPSQWQARAAVTTVSRTFSFAFSRAEWCSPISLRCEWRCV